MTEWISKKYLDREFYELFEKNKGKKIIVFGAGTALHTIPELVPEDVKIDYFVDSRYEEWQQSSYAVKHPIELKKEKPGTFLVLIAGQHTISMKEQLESYGLKEDGDFVDIYGKYEKAFRIAKVDYEGIEIRNFIEKISCNDFNNTIAESKKIGVVVNCTVLGTPLYEIALFFILKKRGYDVELIIDDCYSNENVTIYDGVTEDIKVIIDRVVQQIKDKFDGICIKYISAYGKEELDQADIKLVNEAVHANAMWQRSRKMDRMMRINEEQWEKLTYPLYAENLQRVKSFFVKNKYDVVNIFTGHHGSRYFYPSLGERMGFRVSSHDGAGVIGSTWTTNGRASHRMDICKIIKENLLSEEQKKAVLLEAKRNFDERSHAKSGDNSIVANYQHGTREKVTKNWFDVVIPLNVMWDSSALGANRIFSTEYEWLTETVDYILKYTDATTLVREHPAAAGGDEYNYDSLGKELKKLYKDEKRLYLAESGDALNTYEYIEHCKVVLPLTSTVGVEAALLGKEVISHTNIYYDLLSFVTRANSKEEYFEYISRAVKKNKECSKRQVNDEAWIAYYFGMNYDLKTEFKEANTEWRKRSLKEVEQMEGVDEICKLIADDIPICYHNVKQIEKSFDEEWENIHSIQEWGKYPSEYVIRFVARNYYKAEDRNKVKILDFGCGAGAHTWYLAREGFDVYAFDGSRSAVARVKERLEKEMLNANVQVCDALELNYKNEFFDCVIDSVCIYANTISNIQKMYNNIYQILKSGGQLFTSVFLVDTTGCGTGDEIEKHTYRNITEGNLAGRATVHFFEKDELVALLKKIGFVNLCVDRMDYTDRGNKVSMLLVSAEK